MGKTYEVIKYGWKIKDLNKWIAVINESILVDGY